MSERMHEDLPRELWDASIALDRAYAPLRSRATSLSAARVHLAVRAPVAVPRSVRVMRITSRFTELALAAAVTAFAFVGTASVAPTPSIVEETSVETTTHVTAAYDDQNFFRWIRVGRYAAPSDVLDATISPAHSIDDARPITSERAGQAR